MSERRGNGEPGTVSGGRRQQAQKVELEEGIK